MHTAHARPDSPCIPATTAPPAQAPGSTLERRFRTRLRNIVHVAAILLAVSMVPAIALDSDEMFEDPVKEARAREIGRDLRCLVCQNQSIFDSNAGLAQDLRVVVRERMEAGDSDDEVLEYVRSRFGDYVLLEPPVTSQTYLLWLAPIGFLILGAGLMAAYLRGRREDSSDMQHLTEADLALARHLLEEDKP